ncbi:host-nuclease inhibitor protein [Atlantibacter subterranea]|uniref:host-nuclease inhibitor Gam family protein n=1 Tax=Atlantibacter subterraneus TaxID=255519 RepID=UPI0020C3BEC0|nr:host-nuclease inhibitor Gam family protein [Atlantibacter subterranea]UTJ46628.1 host-nuclease inhibitor protein [Atlantibacter subterranea]
MAYLTQDRIEDASWVNHYAQVAREEEESELADQYEKAFRISFIQKMMEATHADNAAIIALINDDRFLERTYENFRFVAEELAAKQVDINIELRRA